MASPVPAVPPTAPAALIPLGSHAQAAPIELTRPATLVGARKDIVRLHLQSSTVSKAHCVIVLNAWGCYVHDLASRTGVLVNGELVVDRDLVDGDVLQIGRFQFKYRAPAGARGTPMPAAPADLTVSTLTGPLAVTKRVLTVGRRPGCDVQFDDSRVSNVHAIVFEHNGRRFVRDLASRTGTWLGAKPVHQDPLPDGAPLRIGGAILGFLARPAEMPPSADAPLTLADAAPTAVAPVTSAPGFATREDITDDLGTLDLGAIELEPLDFDDAAVDVAGDDLASLRRDWLAPPRPAPTPPAVRPPSEPAVKAPAVEAKAVPPAPPEPEVDAAALGLESAELGVIETPLVAEEKAAPHEVTGTEAVASVPDLSMPTPVVPAAAWAADDLRPEAESLELEPEPAAVDELVPGDADVTGTATIDLDEAAAEPVSDAGPAEIATKSKDATAVSDVSDTPAEHTALVGGPDDADAPARALEPPAVEAGAPETTGRVVVEAEPETPVAVAPPVAPPTVETAAAATAEAVAGSDADDDAFFDLLELDDASPAGPVAVSDSFIASVIAIVPPASVSGEDDAERIEAAAVAEVADRDTAARAAGLVTDPDAPVTEAVDAEIGLRDPDAPSVATDDAIPTVTAAAGSRIAEPTADLVEEVSAPTAAETESGPVIAVDASADEAADHTATFDGIAATADLGTAATVVGEVVTSDDTNAAGVVDAADVAGFDTDGLDPIDLSALDSVDRHVPADEASDAVVDDAPDTMAGTLASTTDATPPPAASSVPTAMPSLADDWDATDASGVTARRPGMTPVEPDLVRLDADDDEESSEATALAVDLGLVLDEDAPDAHEPAPPAAPAAGPGSPVEIDLATAPMARDPQADETVDAPRAADPFAGFGADAARPAASAPADEVFEADIVEAAEFGRDGPDRHAPDDYEPLRPAAEAVGPIGEATDGLNDIAPPSGGSLADLMPSGPPLLGGSFLSLPPMTPPTPQSPSDERPAGPGERRRPLRVGFGQPQRPSRAPFASDRTIADAMGPAAVGDAFSSPSPNVSIPPAAHGSAKGGSSADARSVGGSSAGPADSHADFDADVIDDGGLPAPLDTGPASANPTNFDELDLADLDADAMADARADVGAGAAPLSSGDAEQHELLATAARFRPRGVIRPALAPVAAPLSTPFADTPIRIPDVDPAAAAEQAQKHRRRVNRVIGCLVGMLVLGGGAAGAIYGLIPQKSTLDAMIAYDGLDRLGTEDAGKFRIDQGNALVSEPVRQKAVQSLPPAFKDLGFLADPKRISETVVADPKVRWPADQPTVMRLRVSSADKQSDVTRLRALAQAVVDTADASRRRVDELRGRINGDMGQADQLNRQLGDLGDQLQALQQASANRPDPVKLTALQADYAAAEPVLTGVKARRMDLEARIDLLKRAPTVAAGPVADPVAADEELAKLNAQLATMQKGDSTAKTQAAEANAAARKSLDESIARFQQDLSAAQKLRDNPVLGSYVDAANRIFKETREFTESFIRSQENLRTKVTELTSSLSDKMQARAQKLIEKDPELKKLNDRLAIGTRQYNAAVAQGFGDEAKKSDLELRLLKVKIGEREDAYKNDPVDAEAITQLQNLKDTLQTQIRDNRKYTEERLTAAQNEFLKNTPAVAQLPAEQKALAEGIEAKLAAVNDARRAYDTAAETAQAEQAQAEAAASEKATALRLQIAARRQDVLAAADARRAEDDEAARRVRLEKAQAELADVRQSELNAQHRLADIGSAIDAADKQRRATAQSDADREAKLAERDTKQRDKRAVDVRIAANQARLAGLIVPAPTIEFHDYDEPDRRPLLAGVSAGAIVLLLLVPAIANLLALAREAHPHHGSQGGTTATPSPAARPATPNEGFEPVMLGDAAHDRKALPQPASV